MHTDFVKSAAVQDLFDRASGVNGEGGDPRFKLIFRDLIQSLAEIIVRHDITENEFWGAVNFMSQGAGEFGLIAPGTGVTIASQIEPLRAALRSRRPEANERAISSKPCGSAVRTCRPGARASNAKAIPEDKPPPPHRNVHF